MTIRIEHDTRYLEKCDACLDSSEDITYIDFNIEYSESTGMDLCGACVSELTQKLLTVKLGGKA